MKILKIYIIFYKTLRETLNGNTTFEKFSYKLAASKNMWNYLKN